MTITAAKDVTHDEIATLGKGILAALYTTGSADIKATGADFAAHPDAVHICQDHGSDITADILDMEAGAATPEDCVRWIPQARAAFNRNVRTGQRWPGIYASMSRLTELANAFVAANISNVPIWVADWGISIVTAQQFINMAGGPYPIIGVQYKNEPNDDLDFFSTEWLNNRSGTLATDDSFHGEYVTGGMFDLKDLAIKLQVGPNGPASLLRMTADHYGTFGDVLGQHVQDILTGTKVWSTPVPKGVKLWVD